MSQSSLQARLIAGMLAALAVLSIAMVVYGQFINEAAERVVLRSLLSVEMDQAVQRLQGREAAPAAHTGRMRLYDGATAPLPRGLQGLGPGLHDDIVVDGQDTVALVRDALGRRLVLALEIGEFEREEVRLAREVALSSLALVALFALVLAWGTRRMLRPLDTLASEIERLNPDVPASRLQAPAGATRELQVIADAFNGYLERQARFMERERDFVHLASHELRTPVSVVAQAAELALASDSLAPPDRHQLDRIAATSAHMERLIGLLLLLARDPARIVDGACEVDLVAELDSIVDDHRHLLAGRALAIETMLPSSAPRTVPEPVFRTVFGNLLRNAIEHSGRGTLVVRIEAGGDIVIDDPGEGMTASEISARFAQAARQGGGAGDGIGLPLIARLCEHMQWSLRFEGLDPRGTRTRLTIRG